VSTNKLKSVLTEHEGAGKWHISRFISMIHWVDQFDWSTNKWHSIYISLSDQPMDIG